MIRLGIDASNISSGGGVTHLYEILNAVNLKELGFKSVDVWSNRDTLSKIEDQENLKLKTNSTLEGNLIKRFYWQQKRLTAIAKERYDILYEPAGSYLGSFRPFVTMNRNLQPFDDETKKRYKLSIQKIRISLLKMLQSYTYQEAEGVLFLTEEAKRLTLKSINRRPKKISIIPHGIAKKFFDEPRKQRPIRTYSFDNPFSILYVSRINVYKHQWNVIEAVHALRQKGYPVSLTLVGNIENKQSALLFEKSVNKFDPTCNFIHHYGRIPQERLLGFYHNANAFIFASSCETFGQTLLEAMASGLPIACSKKSAMPEILEDHGIYFNPDRTATIISALNLLLDDEDLRYRLSCSAYQEAKTYSWEKCAISTFNFIKNCVRE